MRPLAAERARREVGASGDDPNNPQLPPLVDIPGEVSPDGQEIWFGPFPGVNPADFPSGIPIWIHKELIYDGTDIITDAPTFEIEVWEWPTVPEPGSVLLAMMGGIGMAAYTWRRRRRS